MAPVNVAKIGGHVGTYGVPPCPGAKIKRPPLFKHIKPPYAIIPSHASAGHLYQSRLTCSSRCIAWDIVRTPSLGIYKNCDPIHRQLSRNSAPLSLILFTSANVTTAIKPKGLCLINFTENNMMDSQRTPYLFIEVALTKQFEGIAAMVLSVMMAALTRLILTSSTSVVIKTQVSHSLQIKGDDNLLVSTY